MTTTATTNHALQQTAFRVTARAFCERSAIYIWTSSVRSAVGHAPRHAPPSLSLRSFGQPIITMIRVLALLFVLTTTCFAGGGGESLVADMNGWTLTLDSSDGSSAHITKSVGDQQLIALIKFPHFRDYLLVAKTLPTTIKNQKSPFRIIEDAAKPSITYLAIDTARPLFELMLLNHRAAFSSFDAAFVEEEINKNPPIDRKFLPNRNFTFKVAARETKLK